MAEQLLTLEQVAEYLNVDKFTVYRLLAEHLCFHGLRPASCLIMSAAFSPIRIAGALVFGDTNVGMIEISATRKFSTPTTRSSSSTTALSSFPYPTCSNCMPRRLSGVANI